MFIYLNRFFTKSIKLKDLNNNYLNKNVKIMGRINNLKIKGNIGFWKLYDEIYSIQCIILKKDLGDEKFNLLKKSLKEGVIEIQGEISSSNEEVKSCFIKDKELIVKDFEIKSPSIESIPIQTQDLLRYNTSDNLPVVNLNNRLNFRFLDLRTEVNNSIFKIKNGICYYFRNYLHSNDFIEIQSPKILSNSSEGGSEIFNFDYFDKKVFLAQSPQLYKQMCVINNIGNVFEIGPVFRAEKSLTYRHLCEFTSLDFEMRIDNSFREVINLAYNLITFIIKNIQKSYAKEFKILNNYFDNSLIFNEEPLIFDFNEMKKLLINEYKESVIDDFSTEQEKILGKYVKKNYNSDLFVIEKFPFSKKPFYTKSDLDSSYSFDIYLRGNEIISGSERENDFNILLSNIKSKNLDPKNWEFFLENFKYGVYRHGGIGLGLERLLMLTLNLPNIRLATLFPRDPKRIVP